MFDTPSRDIAWGRSDTSEALERLRELGVSPALWRTPWGDLAWWSGRSPPSRASGSSTGRSTPTIGAATRRADVRSHSRPARRDGAIVLAHDGIGPGARRDRRCADARFRRAGRRAGPSPTASSWERCVEHRSVGDRSPEAARLPRRGARADRRHRRRPRPGRRSPRFPEREIAALERAGALAWNAQPDERPAARRRPSSSWCGRSRAPMARSGGSSTVTSTPSSDCSSRRPPELRDRELDGDPRRRAPRRRLGRGPAPRRGTARRRSVEVARRRGAARRQDVLLRRRRPGSRAGARPRPRRRSAAGGVGRPRRRGPRRGRRELVSRLRVALLGVSPGGVPRRARPGPVRRAGRAAPSSRGSRRDALRTAATWAGMADAASDAALGRARRQAAARRARGARRRTHRRPPSATISLWLDAAARRWTAARTFPASPSTPGPRSPSSAACCSTRPLAPAARGRSRVPPTLDRCRRDLEVFLLQHRLDPMLARAGVVRPRRSSRDELA